MGRSKRKPKVSAINTRVEVEKKYSNPSDSIIVPEARDRFLDIFEREQIPTSVKSSLSTASAGDMQAQYLVMLAMIDTWPRLQKGIREIKMAARKAPWKVEPYSERGEDPTEQAQAVAKECENALWGMKPDPARQLNSMEGTIEALIEGYFMGHQVIEPRWETKTGKGWVPTSTKVLPARFYGYPYIQDGEDKLMLDPEGRWGGQALVDFPNYRFLIAVNSGHSGHPSVGGPLRALTPYWLAAVYGLKWAMVYSQLFGIPFRWATYADDADKAQVANMMRKIGSSGWGAFKEGTSLNFEESTKGAQSLPQFELMKMADEQCDIFILGQSLTSSVGDSGSRALGEVHNGVRLELIEGICDFVGEIISYQLIPAWSFWNYGEEREDLPGFWAKWEEPKDEKSMAERDVALGILDGKIPVAESWLYDRHNIPMPAEGDKIFKVNLDNSTEIDIFEGDWLDEDESDDEDDGDSLINAKLGRRPKSLKKSKKLKIGTSSVPTGSGNNYDPNQKRIPKGQKNAGRWTDDGIVSKGQRARKGKMRQATEEDRKRFGISPGFKDAKVTDDPKADLVATAINAKGKPVSFYSASYTKKQEAAKFGRIAALNSRMPELQKQIELDAKNGNHQALTMRMITLTGMRNGGDKGGGKVATFGASNLQTSQAKVKGDLVTLDFVGKKGVRQLQSFKDPLIAKHIKSRISSGKKTVFDSNSTKTLNYLKKISNNDFKVHDFRTWNATVMADKTISRIAKKSQLPANETEFKSFQTRVARVVSRRLGNDPAMALKAYIHPAVFNGY